MAKPRRAPAVPKDRADKVRTWLLAGATTSEIEAAAAKEWQISDRQARRYIEAVREQFASEGVTVQQAMLLNTFRRATAQGKFPAAIAALKQLQGVETNDEEEIADFAKAGTPDLTDPLSSVDYAMKLLGVGLQRLTKLKGISTLDRMDEIRKTARAMAALVPDERVYDAEKTIKDDAAGMDDDDGAPELEDAPAIAQGSLRAEAAGAPRRRPAIRTAED